MENQEEIKMKCHRCKGLCIMDYVEENGRYENVGRCINCGSIVFPEKAERTSTLSTTRKHKIGKVAVSVLKKKKVMERICA